MTSTLLDLCSTVVAKSFPFQYIEELYSQIPTPVILSIVREAFPQDELEVRVYAGGGWEGGLGNWDRGIGILEGGGVSKVVQVGFHLSGTVTSRGNNGDGSTTIDPILDPSAAGRSEAKHRVSLTFDRRKITSTTCTCSSRDIFWCEHVVALCLYRIRNNETVIRVPISETLLHLSRDQLQKLLQYLISEHTEVLATAQALADDILLPNSDINHIGGAPDPTAGGSTTDNPRWSLDEDRVGDQVKVYLNQSHYSGSGSLKLIAGLFGKVREMLLHSDSNGPRLLKIITDQFLNNPRVNSSSRVSAGTVASITDKFRPLWEEIGTLWAIITLSPQITPSQKSFFSTLLFKYSSHPLAPSEDPDSDLFHTSSSSSSNHHKRRRKQPRTIFHRALEHLSLPIRGSLEPYPNEPIQFPQDCCKLESLRCHGVECTKYAMGLLEHLRTIQFSDSTSPWLGNLIDPITILFETLLPVEPLAAYEVALIGLGQTRKLFPGLHLQEKLIKTEEKLMKQLSEFTPSVQLTQLLINQSKLFLQYGLHPNVSHCVPLHNFTQFLFNHLIGTDSNLAYELALKSLTLPLTDNGAHHSSSAPTAPAPTIPHYELCQIALASTLLTQSKSSPVLLGKILNTILSTIKSPSLLYKLSQDCFRTETRSLMEISFKIVLQILRLTKGTQHRRRWDVIRWISSCTAELGLESVNWLLKNWREVFIPIEAVGVANTLVGGSGNGAGPTRGVVVGSGILNLLAYSEVERLREAGRRVAIECLSDDPQGCSVASLNLCESDGEAFKTCYDIILRSASVLPSAQLFKVGQYMEQRGFAENAFKLALLGVEGVQITFNQDTHPATQDIHWAAALAHSLGGNPLPTLIPLLVKNVQCSTILAEILRRCIDKKQRTPAMELLLEATLSSYVSTIHSRLSHISPRHYGDFIEFLVKAKESFMLDERSGSAKWAKVIEGIKLGYKGKKKLMGLVGSRFG